jgi:putative oxidoreductase
MMDVVFLIGRILFALVFLLSGLTFHLLAGRKMAIEYARGYRAPMPELTVPLTGLMAVAGAVMVILGLWGDLGALLIAAFLLAITPVMHAWWKEQDAMQKTTQQTHFNKNLGLLGGALILFYAWNQLGADAGLSLTDPLF